MRFRRASPDLKFVGQNRWPVELPNAKISLNHESRLQTVRARSTFSKGSFASHAITDSEPEVLSRFELSLIVFLQIKFDFKPSSPEKLSS